MQPFIIYLYTLAQHDREARLEELKRIREEKGWSQVRLAKESGVDRATINQAERGRRSPSIATLESLARALGSEVGDFFPKIEPQLPLHDPVAGAKYTALDVDSWRQHYETLAEFFEDLADQDVPPSRALGRWDVVPYVAGFALAFLDALLDGTEEGWVIEDEEGELLPLLRAGYRLARVADELWGRGVEALAGEIEQASIEMQFWRMTEGLELTGEQREKITA